ncbi:MAG: hypothetical protein R3F25_12250 [Gammaproteobacteria bacterium]
MAHPKYQTKELCEVFSVPTSTYYDQVKEKPISAKKQQMLRIIKQTAIDQSQLRQMQNEKATKQ